MTKKSVLRFMGKSAKSSVVGAFSLLVERAL